MPHAVSADTMPRRSRKSTVLSIFDTQKHNKTRNIQNKCTGETGRAAEGTDKRTFRQILPEALGDRSGTRSRLQSATHCCRLCIGSRPVHESPHQSCRLQGERVRDGLETRTQKTQFRLQGEAGGEAQSAGTHQSSVVSEKKSTDSRCVDGSEWNTSLVSKSSSSASAPAGTANGSRASAAPSERLRRPLSRLNGLSLALIFVFRSFSYRLISTRSKSKIRFWWLFPFSNVGC